MMMVRGLTSPWPSCPGRAPWQDRSGDRDSSLEGSRGVPLKTSTGLEGISGGQWLFL